MTSRPLSRFLHSGAKAAGHSFDDYAALHRWSIDHPAEFWDCIRTWFDVPMAGKFEVLTPPSDPGVLSGRQWFRGATLNYVDPILRHCERRPDAVAVIDASEPGGAPERTTTYAELARQVSAVAAVLRDRGVSRGDRVAGYVPNTTEAVVAFLATAAIGAIWTSCGQDYSAAAAVDRLGQLEPVVLVTADGYRFAGKNRDKRDAVAAVVAAIPSITTVIAFSRLGTEVPGALPWSDILGSTIVDVGSGSNHVAPEQVPFDHPLWVLFSSGTTGKPKGIVHGHGGVVLEHLKSAALQSDLTEDDVFFWYTSPSWMMWNYLLAGLLVGATIVCYDGSPGHPETGELWSIAARHHVTVLGTSPAYLRQCETAGVDPAATEDLSNLRTLGVTGAVLPASAHPWVADHVGGHIHVASVSGGTDVVSGFVNAPDGVPVVPGEIPAISLAVALEAWDHHGRSVIGEPGEMVITASMPSMPVGFWNDDDGSRYRDAYFSEYPGVWTHGDSITVTERGSVVIHGRSDATLNRNGVRMGSSDIYGVVEHLPAVEECLVVGLEQPDGSYWMPLFVVTVGGADLDD
ncbi:MAG: acetoacetate--CoA ligase, partial [Rhodococcus sp. (in: high G+C Gram-positive bacteria)]